jgi:hypothetical protein
MTIYKRVTLSHNSCQRHQSYGKLFLIFMVCLVNVEYREGYYLHTDLLKLWISQKSNLFRVCIDIICNVKYLFIFFLVMILIWFLTV